MLTRTKTMAEGAVCAALSAVLSYVVIFRMPQGGSVSLEMAPLMFFALRRGTRWGIAVGAIAGVIQVVYGGYVINPVQALLDFPIAFGAIGLCGIASGRDDTRALACGALLAFAARLAAHTASGVIFFAAFAPEGRSALEYSLVYNAAFLCPSAVLSMIVSLAIERHISPKLPIPKPR